MLICVSKFNNLKLNYILRARVCGDRAIAHMHYGGICCYSCKVSFTAKEEESPTEVTVGNYDSTIVQCNTDADFKT